MKLKNPTSLDTGLNEGSGQVQFLDRHILDCGNEKVINQFNLHREGNNFRYNYKNVKYSNNINKVCIICNKCKNEFFQSPSRLLAGQGCKKCYRSKGEIIIENFLKKHYIKYHLRVYLFKVLIR